jgi:hypothetical protein
MRRFFADMNPTLRGFLVIIAIALVVVILNLETTLLSLRLLASIAFFLAIAFFVYQRRSDISTWPGRAQFAFYGGALLIVAALGVFFLRGISGRNALAFFLVLGLSGFSMFRVWRDQHTYG